MKRKTQIKIRSFLRLASVQQRLGVVYGVFLLLLLISVGVTYISLAQQKQDTRIINLAGRQRMLIQQITQLADEYADDPESENASLLRETAATFEKTFTALRTGGPLIDYTGKQLTLTVPSDPTLRSEMDDLADRWQKYQANAENLLNAGSAAQRKQLAGEIEEQSLLLLQRADQVVRVYEDVHTAKQAHLRNFQLAILLLGLASLGAGWWIIRRSVAAPLLQLERAARSVGEGQFADAIPTGGALEVRSLGQTMETMRVQLLSSRLELEQLTKDLETRVQQRTRALEALATVTREINSHLTIGEMLSSVTEKAQALCGSDVASLCLLDKQGKVMRLHAAAGPGESFQKDYSLATHSLVENVLQQPFANPCGVNACEGFCQILHPKFRASHLATPLHSQGKVIGALCVGSANPAAFRSEMLPVLTQLAGAAEVALENSQLYRQAEQAATLEERHRIASEMHDGLLQTLNFLQLMVRWLRDQIQQNEVDKALVTLQQIERAEEQAEREIRRAIASLQDNFPVNYTLQEQLAVLADELSRTGPPITYASNMILPLILTRQEGEQALRVIREALLNAQRYSQAEAVFLYLEEADNEIAVLVQDKGVGFVPQAEPRDGRPHFGIRIMQARAARLGARLEICSSVDEGTTVQLRWKPSSLHQRTGKGENGKNPSSAG